MKYILSIFQFLGFLLLIIVGAGAFLFGGVAIGLLYLILICLVMIVCRLGRKTT